MRGPGSREKGKEEGMRSLFSTFSTLYLPLIFPRNENSFNFAGVLPKVHHRDQFVNKMA
jgi:hypothetical protein